LLGQTGNTAADANEDNIVDLDDYNLWKGNSGATIGSGAEAAVPEPSTLSLVGIAAVVMIVRQLKL
jgi:hypothetical protein